MKTASIIRICLTILLIPIFINLFSVCADASVELEEERTPCYISDFSTIAIDETISEEDAVLTLKDGTEIVQYYNWDNTYIYFGSYEQDNDITTKEEPILWRVVKKSDEGMMLVSDQALDMKPFHNSLQSISWEDCSLRAWLNGYENNPWKSSFLGKAFSEEERELLQTDELGDYVSILTVEEIKEHVTGEKRVSINTDYVRNMGAIDYNGYSMWWTRSMTETANQAILCGGDVDYVGMPVDRALYAVRPVIWLSFDDILFASAVEEGKALYAPGKKMSIVDRATDQIYKLTFTGDKLTMDVEAEETMEVEQGQVLTIPYSNVSTGLHNYISAIITYDSPKDASGESVVYYGKLQQARSETGAVTIYIPDEMNAGDYHLSIFNEMCQTYDKPDYTSVPHTFELKIALKTGGFEIQEVGEQQYTGEAIEPSVVVTDVEGNIVSPLEYRVVYENNIEAGIATIRVLSNRVNYDRACIAEIEFRIVGKQVPLILTCNAVHGDKVYPNHDFHLIARMEPLEDKEAASGGLMEFYMNDELLNPGGTPVDYGYTIYEMADGQLSGYGMKTFYAKYIPQEIDLYGANTSNEVTIYYKADDSEEKLMNYILFTTIGIAFLLLIICIIIFITHKKKATDTRRKHG